MEADLEWYKKLKNSEQVSVMCPMKADLQGPRKLNNSEQIPVVCVCVCVSHGNWSAVI
jgi:hypothetical protein